MKKIATHGISYIEPPEGSCEWYWGSDYAREDLYEAEELYRGHHPVTCNRLVFVRYPDGRIVEPIKGQTGQYFGRPISYSGKIQILLADFPQSSLSILQYDDASGQLTETVFLPLAAVKDCYNLLLRQSPLMLTREANGGKFQIIWLESVEFAIGERESFFMRAGDNLYVSRWREEPEYREEIAV